MDDVTHRSLRPKLTRLKFNRYRCHAHDVGESYAIILLYYTCAENISTANKTKITILHTRISLKYIIFLCTNDRILYIYNIYTKRYDILHDISIFHIGVVVYHRFPTILKWSLPIFRATLSSGATWVQTSGELQLCKAYIVVNINFTNLPT